MKLTTSPNVVCAELAKFNLAPGSPVMVLSPDNISLSGAASGRFHEAAKAPFWDHHRRGGPHDVKRTVPGAFSASDTHDVGVDLGATVSLDYFDRRRL